MTAASCQSDSSSSGSSRISRSAAPARLIYRDRFRWDGPWTTEDVELVLGRCPGRGEPVHRRAGARCPAEPDPAFRRSVFRLDTGESCMRWCGHPGAVTADVVHTALRTGAKLDRRTRCPALAPCLKRPGTEPLVLDPGRANNSPRGCGGLSSGLGHERASEPWPELRRLVRLYRSSSIDGFDAPDLCRLDQGRVILFGLVGVGQGEFRQSRVKVIFPAQVAGDRRGISRLRA